MTFFNVLVYTSEELWYERAAIWLPGQSRFKHIDPLTKLKLQNRRMEGINIGKWKFVKKIVNTKGTRVYVDMPPSAARALEKHKMQLSYELQKVSVFLKAVAIDKEAFDAGLHERSIDIVLPQNLNTMPMFTDTDDKVVQIALKANRRVSFTVANKIKDAVLNAIYRYHQQGGTSRTDFVKYGYARPGTLCVLPENDESRKWLVNTNLGEFNRQPIIIVGEEDTKNVFFDMTVDLPGPMLPKTAIERLKQSNRGVKGINYNLWKNFSVKKVRGEEKLLVHMDLESAETIGKLDYKLDFVIDNRDFTASVYPKHSRRKLEEEIAKYKAEQSDNNDVANMDLASDSDDDVVCLE